jgi:hypothetical protein
VSYGFGSHLSTEVGSDTITCPRDPCGPRVSSIKKRLADLPAQLGMHVPNERVHVSKVPHVRVIVHLQDVRTSSVVNTCKACEHAFTMLLQCDVSTMDHSSGTAIVPK